MKKRWQYALLALLLFVLAFSASCNVYDVLYADDASDDFEKALYNGDAAMKRDDYSLAVTLYADALNMKPTSTLAMKGLASAIILRDIQIRDVPKLMNAIFNIDATGTNTNTFLSGLSTTDTNYKKTLIDAVSNASWWRAPINGINRVTGMIRIDAATLQPMALPTESDGKLPANDRNTMLNYLIIKAVHVALKVQGQFAVTASLVAGINTSTMTNYSTSSLSGDEAVNKTAFTNFHVNFTNTISTLSNAYADILTTLTTTNRNTSLGNLIGVADGMVASIKGSVMTPETQTNAVKAIADIKTSLNNLVTSITNTTGIKSGFDALATFRADIESFALSTTVIGTAKTGAWMPY